MCPICIGAAALATMAGSGSAGGLAALLAVKLHLKRREAGEDMPPNGTKVSISETRTPGDEK